MAIQSINGEPIHDGRFDDTQINPSFGVNMKSMPTGSANQYEIPAGQCDFSKINYFGGGSGLMANSILSISLDDKITEYGDYKFIFAFRQSIPTGIQFIKVAFFIGSNFGYLVNKEVTIPSGKLMLTIEVSITNTIYGVSCVANVTTR